MELIMRVETNKSGAPDFSTAEPIVMCRDCCWASPRALPGETGYRCLFHRIWKGDDGYCDDGERGRR